jgi:hypothetical protein
VTAFRSPAEDTCHIQLGCFQTKEKKPHKVTVRFRVFNKIKLMCGAAEDRLHRERTSLRDQTSALPFSLFGGLTTP